MEEDISTKANSDIQDALREFQIQSGISQEKNYSTQNSTPAVPPKQEVSGVSFETDSYAGFKYVKQTDTPKIVNLVMKYSGGIVTEEHHAYYVVFGIVVIIFGVSLYLFFGDSVINSRVEPTPEKIQELNNAMRIPS